MAAIIENEPRSGGPAGRMIVFVPEDLENVAEFAQQVYDLACAEQRWVLYLALKTRAVDELAAARQLTTLTALTQGAVGASALQTSEAEWVGALTELARPGDLVVLPDARLRLPSGLERDLGLTRQSLPGFYETAQHPKRVSIPWLRPVLFWLIGLLLVVGFSYLEFRLGSLFSGGAAKAALMAAFALELFLLYQWNRIFR